MAIKTKIKKIFFGSFIAALGFFILFFFVFTGSIENGKVLAAALGPQSPTSASNDASVGTVSWSSTANIYLSDNNWATASLGKGAVSNYLVATGFDFSSIPDGAIILGITVRIERSEGGSSANGGIQDNEVKIIQDGSISSVQNKAQSGVWWPAAASEAYIDYGNSSDLWGLGWTSAQIKAANFGVAVSAINVTVSKGGGTETAQIDHITVTVDYSADPLTDQNHFRWRNDDGGEATATWRADEDSNVIGDVVRNNPIRLRVKSANIGVAGEVAGKTYELQYGVKSTTCGDIGSWVGVGNSADAWEMAASNLVEGSAIAVERLTAASSFINGEEREVADTTNLIGPLSSGAGTEIEYSIQATASAVSGTTYCFRLYDTAAGLVLDQYSVYPEATVAYEFSLEQVSYRWRNDDGGEVVGGQSAGYIRPDGDVAAGWGTVFPIGSHFETLNEDVVQPAAGDIGDYISDLAQATDEYSMTTLPGSGSYTGIDVWLYGSTDDNEQIDVTLLAGGVSQGVVNISSFTASYGWHQASFTGLNLNQADLDGLTIRLLEKKTGKGGNSVSIASLYAEVFENVSPASFKAAENTAITGQNKSENTRLRLLIKNNGPDSSGSQNYNLEYAPMAGGDCGGGDESFVGIPILSGCGTSAVCMNLSSNFADQLPSSNISPGLVDPSGTFVSGALVEDPSNNATAISLNSGEFTELEYNFQFTSNATDGGDYCFKITRSGADLSAYTNIARVTLGGGGGGGYSASGTYISNAYNLGSTKTFSIIEWTASKTNDLCSDCIIKLQIKTAASEAGLSGAEWSGPEGKDGDETDFFTNASGGLIHLDHNGDQWIQYMATLTGDGVDSPILEDINIYYK